MRPYGYDYGGKGKGKGRAEHFDRGLYYEPEDQLPRVAQGLSDLRENLSQEGVKVYHSLQQALQRHSLPLGSRPNFEKDFHQSLNLFFPDAWDIRASQIGSWNQWEVKIDRSPAIYCSVRLEVLNDDTGFIQEVKNKARIVKDTLLEDNGRWKRILQPDGAFNFEKLQQFEQECKQRAADYDRGYLDRGTRSGRSVWVEPKASGGHGRGPEDELSRIIGQKVVATFHCRNCEHIWKSYHARLRPDGETIMGQQCSKCGRSGQARDWRVNEDGPMTEPPSSNRQQGMHQSMLCDACREFGNCMGVFYEPFVLTTALSLVSGQYVQWKSFSAEMPELLIADLGPQYRDLQVCLQPHVYVRRQSEPAEEDPYMEQPSTLERATRGAPRGRAAWEPGAAPRAPRGHASPEQRFSERPPTREVGGVKDSSLYEGFLSKVDGPRPRRGGGAAGSAGGSRPDRYQAAGSGDGQPAREPTAKGLAGGARASAGGKSAPLAGDEAGGAPGALRMEGAQSDAMLTPPAAEKVPNASKFNKISMASHVPASQPAAQPSTPKLNELPPLRKAQFLQIVLRQVKASGGTEADKCLLAEEYLVRCNGDYDKAYQYVKSLSEAAQ